nr:uncharacterized protein LOC112546643 [Pelodiscus sinensis]|eukprot:XP_025043134.1 uncharacterized protein LOC112546643 [Pelodiscus sinensis]
MGISGKFLKLWRNHFTVISTSVYSLVLVVLEHSIDPNFKCPEDKMQTLSYSLCYILLPPAALFLLGLAVQLPLKWEDSLSYECYRCCELLNRRLTITEPCLKICERVCSIIFKALVPAVLWIIIVLLDGKYIDCLCKSPQANCPTARSPYHVSQVAGLGVIGSIALLGFLYCCFRNCWRKRVTMNVFQSRERLRVQAADYLNEQQNEVIRKLIEKHLNKRYIAAPATFVTGLRDVDVSFEIRRALNVLWEKQNPSDRAQSREHGAGGAQSREHGAGGAQSGEHGAGGAQSGEHGAGGAQSGEHGAGGAQSGEHGAGGAQSGEHGAGGAQGGAQSAPSSPSLQEASSSRGHPYLDSGETQNVPSSESERTPLEVWTSVPASAISQETSLTQTRPPTKSTKKQSRKDKWTCPEANPQESIPLFPPKVPPSQTRPGGL